MSKVSARWVLTEDQNASMVTTAKEHLGRLNMTRQIPTQILFMLHRDMGQGYTKV